MNFQNNFLLFFSNVYQKREEASYMQISRRNDQKKKKFKNH